MKPYQGDTFDDPVICPITGNFNASKFPFYLGGLSAFKLGFCASVDIASDYRRKLMRSSCGQFRPEKKKKTQKFPL